MQTQSHLLLSAVLDRPLRRRGLDVHLPAFLVGSVLPDVPFFLLTVLYSAYYWWIAPIAPDQTLMSIMEHIHFQHFFIDPVWIVLHNFFHAPLILLGIGGMGWWLTERNRGWGRWLLWFALGAGLHSIIDVFTHTSDGPLVFFPLDWGYRFQSPVSYWEGESGRIFGVFEMALNVLFIGYLGWRWWQKRQSRETDSEPT